MISVIPRYGPFPCVLLLPRPWYVFISLNVKLDQATLSLMGTSHSNRLLLVSIWVLFGILFLTCTVWCARKLAWAEATREVPCQIPGNSQHGETHTGLMIGYIPPLLPSSLLLPLPHHITLCTITRLSRRPTRRLLNSNIMRDFVVFPDEIQQAASRLRERLEYAVCIPVSREENH